jgi:hypothetical protein
VVVWFELIASEVLVSGVHSSDRKKIATFRQWGEHPIPTPDLKLYHYLEGCQNLCLSAMSCTIVGVQDL